MVNEEMFRFDSRWFVGLNEQEKTDVKKFLVSDKKVLDILRKICYNICTGTEEIKQADYDCPSWSHKQAHLNGMRDAMNKIIRLLNIEKEDLTNVR